MSVAPSENSDLVGWLLSELSRDDDRFEVGHAADAEWRRRDVESKRQLIYEYRRAHHALAQMERMAADDPPALERPRAEAAVWDRVLALIAESYSARSGYRPEWRAV